jgi:hypothetical protein
LFGINGEYPFCEHKNVSLPPNSSTLIASFEKSAFEKAGFKDHGAFALLKDKETMVSQHRLFLTKFKEMNLPKPQISIRKSDDKMILVSPVFVWGLCLDLDGESDIPDNCFDLLPDIPYVVNCKKDSRFEIKMTGNDLLNRKMSF